MGERTYRYRCTAMGTSYVHETWRDHTPSARRTHIYGKIVSLHDEGRSENMTPARYGIPLLIALAVLAALWIVALSPASPPASPEANATTSAEGDGAGEGRGR